MELAAIPGYKDLFGTPTITYDELLQNLPSHLVISVLISINAELNAPIPAEENQDRIRQLISFNFSREQLWGLDSAFRRYNQIDSSYDKTVFGRRYLIAMILKELNRNFDCEFDEKFIRTEYNFLMAYFLIVDEINEVTHKLSFEAFEKTSEPNGNYRLLWTPLINQYNFSHTTDTPYELSKLLCFSKYTIENLKPFLKEYLISLGFDNLSSFVNSLYQLSTATLHYDKKDPLSKFSRIVPMKGIDDNHLKQLSINSLIGGVDLIQLSDIKKKPLFRNSKEEYLIIDNDIYNQKLYYGPFFDLYYQTKMKNSMNFNSYSTEISKNVLEGIFFKSIMKSLRVSKHDIINFDEENADYAPDCYYRYNKTIFLFEFKANIFADKLISNPSFDEIKAYIDERFIKNKNGKPKGITQLWQHIKLLNENKFIFDEKLNANLNKGKYTIYPIVCYTDNTFSMPGINEYLNDEFANLNSNNFSKRLLIKNVTLINIELLFDFIAHNGNIKKLENLIERYWDILKNRKQKFHKDQKVNSYLTSKSSFADMYSLLVRQIYKNPSSGLKVDKLKDILGITQAQLDEKFV